MKSRTKGMVGTVFGAVLAVLAGVALSAPGPAGPVEQKAGKIQVASDRASVREGQKKWDAVVAAARKEGRLVMYSGNGPRVRDLLIRVMKEKYGIALDFVAGPGADLSTRVLTEKRANVQSADVVLIGTQIFTSLKPADAVIPLDDSILMPEARDLGAWPERRLPFLDKAHTGVGLTGAYWSYVLVNTDMIKDNELTSCQDLLNPAYKDRILMGNPARPGATMNWVMFIREKIMPGPKGDKFLQDLAKQNPAINHDYRTQVEWAARGKYPIVIGASGQDIVAQFKKEGAPIAWKRMKEGGLIHPAAGVFAIVKGAAHANAAKVLLNWLLTKEGQEQYSQAFGQPGVRLGVSTAGIDPFMVPLPGEKVYFWDEGFGYKVQTEGPKVAKTIFGALLR